MQEWMWLVLLAAIVVLVVFLIRVLIQLNRLTRDMDGLLKKLEVDIIPLTRNFKETSENVNRITMQVQDRVEQTENLFRALKETSQILLTVNRVLKGGVSTTLINLAGLGAGLKAGSQAFFKNRRKGG